jgi:hypothetical protein
MRANSIVRYLVEELVHILPLLELYKVDPVIGWKGRTVNNLFMARTTRSYLPWEDRPTPFLRYPLRK